MFMRHKILNKWVCSTTGYWR